MKKTRDFFKNKIKQVEEIENLEKGLELFTRGEHRSTAHFKMVAHFGNPSDYQKMSIERKYNDRFIKLVKEILLEKEEELKK